MVALEYKRDDLATRGRVTLQPLTVCWSSRQARTTWPLLMVMVVMVMMVMTVMVVVVMVMVVMVVMVVTVMVTICRSSWQARTTWSLLLLLSDGKYFSPPEKVP